MSGRSALQQASELEQAGKISPRVDRPPNVLEVDEPTSASRRLTQRPFPVSRDRDLEGPARAGKSDVTYV
jgi:hypothetical protein